MYLRNVGSRGRLHLSLSKQRNQLSHTSFRPLHGHLLHKALYQIKYHNLLILTAVLPVASLSVSTALKEPDITLKAP